MKIQKTIIFAGLLAVTGLMGCEHSRQNCCSCQSSGSYAVGPTTTIVEPAPSAYDEAPAPPAGDIEEAPPAPNTEPQKLPEPAEASAWRARPVIR